MTGPQLTAFEIHAGASGSALVYWCSGPSSLTAARCGGQREVAVPTDVPYRDRQACRAAPQSVRTSPTDAAVMTRSA
jgi:hypothetical protein